MPTRGVVNVLSIFRLGHCEKRTRCDENMEAEMQEAQIKKNNREWHKRRGKILRRKRQLTKVLGFLDRLLTWIWAVKTDE